jgi:hypothetical protein
MILCSFIHYFFSFNMIELCFKTSKQLNSQRLFLDLIHQTKIILKYQSNENQKHFSWPGANFTNTNFENLPKYFNLSCLVNLETFL